MPSAHHRQVSTLALLCGFKCPTVRRQVTRPDRLLGVGRRLPFRMAHQCKVQLPRQPILSWRQSRRCAGRLTRPSWRDENLVSSDGDQGRPLAGHGGPAVALLDGLHQKYGGSEPVLPGRAQVSFGPRYDHLDAPRRMDSGHSPVDARAATVLYEGHHAAADTGMPVFCAERSPHTRERCAWGYPPILPCAGNWRRKGLDS